MEVARLTARAGELDAEDRALLRARLSALAGAGAGATPPPLLPALGGPMPGRTAE